jgi:sulfur carrier protein
MSIEVNQKTVEWVENETVEQLLKRMKYTFPLVVVKIDERIILKKDFSIAKIPDKSKIVVLHMISGG